jgi:hypothetical protein
LFVSSSTLPLPYFCLLADAFNPKFLELVARIKEGIALDELLERDLLHKEVDDVYSFPMLSIEFCERFLEEMDNFCASGLPITRPNSMNNYGLVVNKIGLEPSITHFQHNYILPVAKLLYPKQAILFSNNIYPPASHTHTQVHTHTHTQIQTHTHTHTHTHTVNLHEHRTQIGRSIRFTPLLHG